MHVRLVCARHPHPVFPEQMEDASQEVGQESTPEVPQDQMPQVEGAISASVESQLESSQPQVGVDIFVRFHWCYSNQEEDNDLNSCVVVSIK